MKALLGGGILEKEEVIVVVRRHVCGCLKFEEKENGYMITKVVSAEEESAFLALSREREQRQQKAEREFGETAEEKGRIFLPGVLPVLLPLHVSQMTADGI